MSQPPTAPSAKAIPTGHPTGDESLRWSPGVSERPNAGAAAGVAAGTGVGVPVAAGLAGALAVADGAAVGVAGASMELIDEGPTDSSNTALGHSAGAGLTKGSNTALGHSVGAGLTKASNNVDVANSGVATTVTARVAGVALGVASGVEDGRGVAFFVEHWLPPLEYADGF